MTLSRWLIRLELQARRHPVVAFQAVVSTVHHDYGFRSLMMIVAAYATSQTFQALIVRDFEASMRWQVLRFLQKYSTCEFSPIDIESVVPTAVVARFSGLAMPSLSPLIRILEGTLRRALRYRKHEDELGYRTKLYCVARGNAQRKPCPTAFMVPAGGYIFLTEKPGNILGIQRFYLLHELGHLSGYSRYTSMRARLGGAPFFFVLIWSLPQLSQAGVLVAILFWQFLRFLRDEVWYLVGKAGAAVDEMEADNFALANLEDSERLELAQFYSKREIPSDPTLIKEGDEARRRVLARNLASIRANGGKLQGAYSFRQPSQTEWQVWVCYGLSVLLAVCTRPMSDFSVIVLAFLAMTMIAISVGLTAMSSRLHEGILSVIERRCSVPAEIVTEWPQEPRWLRNIRVFIGIEHSEKARSKIDAILERRRRSTAAEKNT